MKNFCGAGGDNLLLEIHARNFLLFNEIDLDFSKGFNVITGETGSGKSMFVKLLRSLSGEFKAKELIGNFEDKFWVEAVFDGNKNTNVLLEKNDIPVEAEMFIRLSGTSERYTSRINGSIVPLSFLKEIMEKEIEIHSQNAFQKLKSNVYHTLLLDQFGKKDLSKILKNYSKIYNEYLELLKIQKDLPGNESVVMRNLEFLEFQIKEIEECNIQDNEDKTVSEELKILSNYEFIKSSLYEIMNIMDNNNDMPSVFDSLHTINHKLIKISDIDENLLGCKDEFEILIENLSEIGKNIYSYVDSLEYDEQELNSLELRMKVIEHIKKKYGPSLNDVFMNLNEFKSEKNEILDKIEKIKTIDREIENKRSELNILDEKIRIKRKEYGETFASIIMKELSDLKMEKAEIRCDFVELDDFTLHGKHLIEITASMNPGAEFRPIAKIASGGELSRLYLAIEIALKGNVEVRTVVFDEIDTGVGARLGDIIGRKIATLEEFSLQSFLITHLPQPAALAKKHFKVGKKLLGEETVSCVQELTGEIRNAEIKEMIGNIPEI